MLARLEVQDLSWSFPGASAPLLSGISFSLPDGLTGLVGPNGAGKSLLLSLLCGLRIPGQGRVLRRAETALLPQGAAERRVGTVADALGIRNRLDALLRLEAGTARPGDLELAEDGWDLPGRAADALSGTGLAGLPLRQELATLSGGERLRAALAGLRLRRAQVLLLDEPTNHLDRTGRRQLLEFLATHKGAVLAASHDRELLEACGSLLEISEGKLRAWGGGWELWHTGREREDLQRQEREAAAKRSLRETAQRRQEAIERQARRESAGRREGLSGGIPKILAGNLARNSEGTAARLREVHNARLEEARQDLRACSFRSPAPLFLDIILPEASRGALSIIGFSPAPAGIPLWDPPLDLELRAPARLALTGRNGAGKSLLLQSLSGERLPAIGTARTFGRTARLDQELSLLPGGTAVREAFAHHAPELSETERTTRLGRLRLQGERAVLPISELSGGERLRLALACLLCGSNVPDVLLLDEPTNHLDLESVAVLVAALAGWKGLLVVASHDERLLEELGTRERIDLDRRRRAGEGRRSSSS